MSVRLCSNFEFASDNLLQVYNWLRDLRPEVRRQVRGWTAAAVVGEALESIDQAAAQGEKAPDSPIGAATMEVLRRQREITRSGYRDPAVDFELLVYVYPYQGSIYGQIVSEQEILRGLIRSQPWFRDLSYWDGSDRPKGITAEEWEARGHLWSDIFGQTSDHSPAGAGLSVQVSPGPNFLCTREELAAAVPTVEARAARIARTLIVSSRAGLILASCGGEEQAPMSEYVRAYLSACDWLETQEGSNELSSETARILPLLPDIAGQLGQDA